MLNIGTKVNKLYCDKHGYSYKKVVGNSIGNKPIHCAFNKPFIILEEMKKNIYDWILYVDTDAIIIDHNIKLENIIDEFKNKSLAFCRGIDDSNDVIYDINNGVFFVNAKKLYSYQIMTRWIQDIYSLFDDKKNIDTDWKTGLHDQDILQILLIKMCMLNKKELINNIKIYKGSEYNKFNYDGSFIRHFNRFDNNDDNNARLNKLLEISKQFII